MRIAIVDDCRSDEKHLVEMLSSQLEKRGYALVEFDTFSSGEALLEALQPGKYDAIFMDIYMQGLNGIDTAGRVRELDGDVRLFFITSSNEYAAESYALRADYYLLKPVTEASIEGMLNTVSLAAKPHNPVLTMPGGVQCPMQSIQYTEYSNHQITLHLENGQARKVWMAQAEMEKLLGSRDFVTCTKGIIIGLRWVDRLDGTTVVMKDGMRIPVSRSRKNDVKQAHADYLFRLLQN